VNRPLPLWFGATGLILLPQFLLGERRRVQPLLHQPLWLRNRVNVLHADIHVVGLPALLLVVLGHPGGTQTGLPEHLHAELPPDEVVRPQDPPPLVHLTEPRNLLGKQIQQDLGHHLVRQLHQVVMSQLQGG